MAIIMISYSIIFFIIQSKDADIKEKIFRFIGLTHEDDSFNAEEQLNKPKYRENIDDLVKKSYVDKEDEELKRRIARNEGMLIINNGQVIFNYLILFFL